MNYLQPVNRRSTDAAWPLKRADGTRWSEKPREGYNPLDRGAIAPMVGA